jgi:hypothetical protein
MMRRTLALVAGLALVLVVAPAAQAALAPAWRTNLGAAANDVAVGPGGALYAVGYAPPGTPEFQKGRAIVSRMTTSGDVMWTRTWKPHPERPKAFMATAVAVAVGENGVVYVVGNVQRFNCEGGGWFIRAYSPHGKLLHSGGTESAWYCRRPGPQIVRDVAVRGDLVVVSAARTGCCGTAALLDGYLRGYSTKLHARWTSNFEPPAGTPHRWYDVADSVGISDAGFVYAAGWSATRHSNGETTPRGALTIERFGHGGNSKWSRRPGVVMPYDGAVSMVLTGSRLLVGAQMRSGGISAESLSATATPVWRRTWGNDKSIRAQLGGVATDSLGRLWLSGSRIDGSDSGRNVFVRRYGASGALTGSLTIDLAPRWADGTSVATLGTTAFATGRTFSRAHDSFLTGKVWRISG